MILMPAPTDDTFHLSPFPFLHANTISPLCIPSSNPPDLSAEPGTSEEGRNSDSEGAMWDTHSQEPAQGSDIVVPPPNNSAEAYLLLEAARADRQVHLMRKNLVIQIIHRNTLTLQYNRLVLERAQEDLRAADRLVGRVRFTIRKSRIPVAFEYAMREDYSVHLPHGSHSCMPSPSTVFDVKLD